MTERPPPGSPPTAGEQDSPSLTPGWCAREVEQELPGLRLLSAQVDVGAQRLADRRLSAGHPRGGCASSPTASAAPRAIGVRREPVPAAYRVFFRHIGLDPDVARTPIEEAVLERMLRGGFLSGGLLEDVLLIALIDTGVPVWALDAERVDGPLGHPRERRGRAAGTLAPVRRSCPAGQARGRRRLGAAGGPVRRARASAPAARARPPR